LEITLLLTSILKMSLMIGIGLIVPKFVALTADVKRFLIFILVNVALPSLIFNGIIQLKIDSELMVQIFSMIGLSLFVHIAGLSVAWFAAKSIKTLAHKAHEISLLSVVGNTGIIGVPLCASLFGPKGALFASVFDVGMSFTLWTIAVMVLKKDLKFNLASLRSVLNMPMIAVVAGLTIAVSGLNTSEFLKDVTGTLAKMTSPLAMIYLGSLISMSLPSIKQSLSLHLIPPIFGKLVFFPVVAAILTMVIGVPKEMAQVIIVESTLPMATTVAIVFARYHADETLALLSTLLSTVLSLVSIPLLVYLAHLTVF